jgi:hypothetical protein
LGYNIFLLKKCRGAILASLAKLTKFLKLREF